MSIGMAFRSWSFVAENIAESCCRESVTSCRPFLADMRCPNVSNGAPEQGDKEAEATVAMFPVIQVFT